MKSDRFDNSFDMFIAWLYGPGVMGDAQYTEMQKAFYGGFIACFKFISEEVPKLGLERGTLEIYSLSEEIEECFNELKAERNE